MSVKKRVDALKNFKKTVNCFFKKGKLTAEYRSEKIMGVIPSGAVFAAYSRGIGRIIACSPDSVSLLAEGKRFSNCSAYGGPSPFLIEDYVNGSAKAIIIAGNFATICRVTSSDVYELKYTLSCGVMHCGRLFGADGYTLRWSGPGGFDDWEEGIDGCGYLLTDPAHGEILNLLVYGGKLVAVREYGITVFNMLSFPENFCVEDTYSYRDKTYKNTASIVNGKIYFFTKSGLKCFDGAKISPVGLRHAVSDPINAVEYGGKYFLACHSEDLDCLAILCVDTVDGDSCILDEPAEFLFVKDGVRYLHTGNIKEQHKLIEGGSFYFESGEIDFGTKGPKTVTELTVSGNAQVSILGDKYARHFYVENSTVRPHLRGNRFTVVARGEGEVNAISITAEVTDAV